MCNEVVLKVHMPCEGCNVGVWEWWESLSSHYKLSYEQYKALICYSNNKKICYSKKAFTYYSKKWFPPPISTTLSNTHKVSKCLRGFDGIQDVLINSAHHKAIVKEKKIDPLKVLRRLRKTYSINVELISPKFLKLENKEKKEDKVPLKVVALKVNLHCEGCAHDIKKGLERMRVLGSLSVEPNMEKSRVTVRGIVDATKLVEYIEKRLGKHAEILDREIEQGNYCKEEIVEWKNKWVHLSPSSAQCVCLLHMFSDENPFSCSIM